MARALALGLLLISLSSPVPAEDALIAVAANFAEVMDRLEQEFEQAGPHRLTIAVGSTGKLFAQIVHGAPFDVLLAADDERPRRLVERGLAIEGSRWTYALGRLALWSGTAGPVDESVLRVGTYRSLAIANPELAPYGEAAIEVLQALDIFDKVRDRLVFGENVGQAHALVASGAAELGLVARSQVDDEAGWVVPAALHAPIRQDAVLLKHGASNEAARAFLEFLRGSRARALITGNGE